MGTREKLISKIMSYSATEYHKEGDLFGITKKSDKEGYYYWDKEVLTSFNTTKLIEVLEDL